MRRSDRSVVEVLTGEPQGEPGHGPTRIELPLMEKALTPEQQRLMLEMGQRLLNAPEGYEVVIYRYGRVLRARLLGKEYADGA